MKFKEAFSGQLEQIPVLTETTLTEMNDQFCAVSGEHYKAGDQVLFVMLPTPVGECDYAAVTAKQAVLEAKDWDYLEPQAGSIPRVDPKSFQG